MKRATGHNKIQKLVSVLICSALLLLQVSAISESADADEKAEEIFTNLAKSYNSALGHLESLQKMMDNNSENKTDKFDSFWFFNMFLDVDFRIYNAYAHYALEVRPEGDASAPDFIYETLFVPVYDRFGHTQDGLASACIIINNIVWRDEKAQEHLDEQKQALRQFKKDYPTHELLKPLQDMYKATLNVVDYAYNDRPAVTAISFITKIHEYQDTKRNLKGEFDLYFDWPDSIYPGTREEYREFYISYWEKNEAAKKAEKEREKAEQEAKKERFGTITIRKDQANLAAHSNYTGTNGNFSEGLCVMVREEVLKNGSTNHYYGVVDTTGTLVIPMQDHLLQECHDGAFCFMEKKDNSWYYGYIDRNGKQILPAVSTSKNDFSEGFAAIETAEGNYYIDNTGGKYDLPEGVSGKSFYNGYAVVTKGIKQYGLINKNMEIVVPMEYENVRNFNSKGIGPVKKDGLYYLINTYGKRLIEQGYESIELASDSDYFVARNTEGLSGIIDPDGNEVVPCVHKALQAGPERIIRNGLLPVWREEGKSIDFINTQGEIVISGNWMATTGFYNGFASVTDSETQVAAVINITGKVVEINKTGTTADKFWYDGLNNMFVTRREEGEKTYYSLFNADGTRLLGNCDIIRCGEGYIAVIQDGYFTIFDKELNTVY